MLLSIIAGGTTTTCAILKKKDRIYLSKGDNMDKKKFEEDFIKITIRFIVKKETMGKDLSYGELVYLQEHQDYVKKMYPDDPHVWEVAGIPEEDWIEQRG